MLKKNFVIIQIQNQSNSQMMELSSYEFMITSRNLNAFKTEVKPLTLHNEEQK